MSASTTYDVQVRYGLTDNASKKIGLIGGAAERANRSAGGLGSTLGKLASIAAIGFGFRAAKTVLVDYNSTLEQSRIAIAGITQTNLGGTINEGLADADVLMKRFQADAKASVGTLADFTAVGQRITGPLLQAGGSMQDIADLTKGAVIASQAFGIDAEVVARDVSQALQGRATQMDVSTKLLGLDPTTLNKTMKKSSKEGLKMITGAFNSPAIQAMAKLQGESFAGQTSTLKDNLQQALGKVGLPLMEKLTAEAKHVNEWIDANGAKIKLWIDKAGSALAVGFDKLKEAVGWIVDNKDTLLALAKAFIGFKVATGLGDMGSNFVGAITSFSKELTNGTKGLAGFSSRLGMAVGGLVALYYGAKAIAEWVDTAQDHSIQRATQIGFLKERVSQVGGWARGGIGHGNAAGLTDAREQSRKGMIAARGAGIVDDAGNVTAAGKKKVAEGLGLDAIGSTNPAMASAAAAQQMVLDKWLADFAILQKLNSQEETRIFQEGAALWGSTIVDALADEMYLHNVNLENILNGSAIVQGVNAIAAFFGGKLDGSDRHAARRPGDKTNITIKKIEVVSDDPDRVAFGLVGAFQDMAANGTQSRRRMPGVR